WDVVDAAGIAAGNTVFVDGRGQYRLGNGRSVVVDADQTRSFNEIAVSVGRANGNVEVNIVLGIVAPLTVQRRTVDRRFLGNREVARGGIQRHGDDQGATLFDQQVAGGSLNLVGEARRSASGAQAISQPAVTTKSIDVAFDEVATTVVVRSAGIATRLGIVIQRVADAERYADRRVGNG